LYIDIIAPLSDLSTVGRKFAAFGDKNSASLKMKRGLPLYNQIDDIHFLFSFAVFREAVSIFFISRQSFSIDSP